MQSIPEQPNAQQERRSNCDAVAVTPLSECMKLFSPPVAGTSTSIAKVHILCGKIVRLSGPIATRGTDDMLVLWLNDASLLEQQSFRVHLFRRTFTNHESIHVGDIAYLTGVTIKGSGSTCLATASSTSSNFSCWRQVRSTSGPAAASETPAAVLALHPPWEHLFTSSTTDATRVCVDHRHSNGSDEQRVTVMRVARWFTAKLLTLPSNDCKGEVDKAGAVSPSNAVVADPFRTIHKTSFPIGIEGNSACTLHSVVHPACKRFLISRVCCCFCCVAASGG